MTNTGGFDQARDDVTTLLPVARLYLEYLDIINNLGSHLVKRSLVPPTINIDDVRDVVKRWDTPECRPQTTRVVSYPAPDDH